MRTGTWSDSDVDREEIPKPAPLLASKGPLAVKIPPSKKYLFIVPVMDVAIVSFIAAAMADPTRVSVLQLADGKRAVGVIAIELGVSSSDVSFHIKRLREVGLVEVVRKGRRHVPRRLPGGAERLVRALG